MNAIIESQYFPPVSLISASFAATHIIFDQYELHRKMSFRNRMLLAGANGIVGLSIPLTEGRNQQVPAKEVRISNAQPWQSQHWKTIQSNYNRSPWFEFYRDGLSDLYRTPQEFLLDWNIDCLRFVLDKLGWKGTIGKSDAINLSYDAATWTDLRNTVTLKNYASQGTGHYRQVFEERTGFLPNLSILDLLCCEGKNARSLLG